MVNIDHINEGATVPQWTLGDRLHKARTSAGLSQQQLAELIDVHRRSVTNYEGDRFAPKRPVLISWALACGVPLVWLIDGTVPATPPNGPDTTGDVEGLPTGR